MIDTSYKDLLLEGSYSKHSPHVIIPALITPKSLVLDVGCNTGYMARRLAKKKCVCDGIDINKNALKKAKKFCRHVYQRDLSKGKLQIKPEKYNAIICADVLEHLPRPSLLLSDCKKYLKKDGTVFISLPNVARLEIRLNLLLGKFDYVKGGIMSSDHLKFFTKKSATGMINDSGFVVKKYIPTGFGHIMPLFPTLTAFQFIYVCKKTN